MTIPKLAKAALCGAAMLGLNAAPSWAAADTTDILIQVLVRKGVLTAAEAESIRQEVHTAAAAQEAALVEAVSAKALSAGPAGGYVPMPAKLSGLKLYGDARFRYQYENAEKINGDNNDRSRFRYRARFGVDMSFMDTGYSMGARLETASSNDSTNVNYGGFFDKVGDELYLGLLYLDYQGEDWSIALGKHTQPFLISGAFWDSDINPEGLSESVSLGGGWSLTAGQYLIDEENESKEKPGFPRVDDDFLFVGQAKWTNGRGLTIAPMAMATTGGVSTASESASFSGENAIASFHDFFVVALPFEYKFEAGGAKQSLFGTYGVNLQADKAVRDPSSPYYAPGSSAEDTFFNLGYKWGSAKRAGETEWGIEYRHIEGASITPNLSDSDFAKNHTNSRGIVVSGAYAFTDFFFGGLTYSKSERIDSGYTSSVADAGDVQVLQIDASVKF